MDVIIRKYNSSHALWFRNSKSFLLLEEPAFEVLKNHRKNKPVEEIIRICRDKYGHLEADIQAFVNEIIEYIEAYDSPGDRITVSKKEEVVGKEISCTTPLVVQYKVGDKRFQIAFAGEMLKCTIHPIISHLEAETIPMPPIKIECLECGDILVLKCNGELIEAFSKEQIEYFTGSTKQLLISLLYGKDYHYWMCMLHASGITANNKAVLFSAASGCGKSTLSALLKARGYGYISDDFIAADKAGRAWAFPDAISVKKGAFKRLSEYYPELEEIREQDTFIGKTVKYLPVSKDSEQGLPVKAFVFVNYTSDGEFIFEDVDKTTALQLLLKETWVNPEPEFVSSFFDWIEKTHFYRLQYAAIEDAEQAVKQIFGE